MLLEVNKNGIDGFSSIQEAINNANEGDEIRINEGVYYEKLIVDKKNITIKGVDNKSCIIEYDDYARKPHEDGKDYGTFRTYSVLVNADGVVISDLTIKNTAGIGDKVGQAIALYLNASEIVVKNCILDAYQDTLFIAPLPPAPKNPGSFIGPSEHDLYRTCYSYFVETTIIGDVDYIFGSGLALFNRCSMVMRNRNKEVNGYVTAPSTWENEAYGYVFVECDFLGEEGIKAGSAFLGRPWRPYGQVALYQCRVGSFIHRELFDDWRNKDNRKTTKFSLNNTVVSETVLDIDKEFVSITDHDLNETILSQWHRDQLKV